MYKKFEAAANEELLPLKLFIVRQLAGKNAKPTTPASVNQLSLRDAGE
jgi:hypothetical protein